MKLYYIDKKTEKAVKKHLKGCEYSRQLQKKLDQLGSVDVLADLYKFNSTKLEKLSGRDNEYSIRVNEKYRLIFSPRNGTAPYNITEIDIIEFSNHYQ